MPQATRSDTATTAVRLTVAAKRFRARLREEAGATSTGLSTSQLAILRRVIDFGPITAAALAAVEHVSQQAIAQSLALMKSDKLVETKRDPNDGRKALVSATRAGKGLLDSALAMRDEWLVDAIDATIPDEERATLEQAIEILERLADASLGKQARSR
jgi:DNA-binding MarR family transcriptional regulator